MPGLTPREEAVLSKLSDFESSSTAWAISTDLDDDLRISVSPQEAQSALKSLARKRLVRSEGGTFDGQEEYSITPLGEAEVNGI